MAWTPEEQKEHRRLWVAALRSGKYEQGRGVLRTANNQFCCLGVACDISGVGHWSDEREYYAGDDAKYAVLPRPVMAWLGLRDTGGEFGRRDSLIDQNDGGKTFAEIADIIESEPEGLLA